MNKLNDFPYKNVLVLGLAKSGTAAANVLLDNHKQVRVNDYRTDDKASIVQQLRKKGAEVIVGSHPLSILDNIEVIIKNPGIPYDNPVVAEAEKRDIPIITEVELATQLANKSDIIGITGSNGKTTTTTLVAEMLKNSGQPMKLAGNIGVPSIAIAEELKEEEKLLLELSSFQLQGIEKFHVQTAVLLNLYEAHLDYHGSMDNYVNAKTNVFKNQTKEDYLVYNADDEKVVSVVKKAKSFLIPFSVNTAQPDGAYVEDEVIYFRNKPIIELSEVVLVGDHNIENILAAICVALLNGANIDGVKKVLTSFSGVEHRLQFVKKIDGRLFYNDSKATNILATQKALRSFNKPTILLAGGLDRGNSFDSLLPDLKNVKALIVFGETASKFQALGEKAKIKKVVKAEEVQEATKRAFELSEEGDVILLSPACASWDQYKTFEERGDMFTRTVHILA